MLLFGNRLRRWLCWNRSVKAASRVLVSVYLQPKAMPYRSMSNRSRKILLTTSMWSIGVCLIVFFVIYTVLLMAVDKPFPRASTRKELFRSMSIDGGRPRHKFQGRGTGSKNSSLSSFSSSRRSAQFWDPGALGDDGRRAPVCRANSLFIVLITSSTDHFEHRREIRRTWCNSSLSVPDTVRWQCVFLVGRTNDSRVWAALGEEGRRHGDLLRGDYLDSYRNLTLKVLHGLWWVGARCPAPYVLKTDDDCFANTLLLQQFLLLHNVDTSALYAGGMVAQPEKRRVIRRPGEKWSVSREAYPPDYYPIYASGSGYVLSFDAASRAVEESRYVKPIPNEDAYLGILMERLSILPKPSSRFTLSSTGLRVCNFLYVFVAHGVAPPSQREMNAKMVAAQRECSSKEDVTEW